MNAKFILLDRILEGHEHELGSAMLGIALLLHRAVSQAFILPCTNAEWTLETWRNSRRQTQQKEKLLHVMGVSRDTTDVVLQTNKIQLFL